MQKSGQHAIIRWICRQYPSALHVNCVLREDLEKPRASNFYKNGDLIWSKEITPLESTQIDCHTLLWNVEGEPIEKYNDWNQIVVVRDPLNLFASRQKRGTTNTSYIDAYGRDIDPIKVYKQHIEKYTSGDTVGVNFNYWFKRKEYRRDIARHLHLGFTDIGVNDVLEGKGHGGASSFDRTTYHGKAQEMDVLNRYKDVDVSKLMDKELLDISRHLFGMNVKWDMRRKIR